MRFPTCELCSPDNANTVHYSCRSSPVHLKLPSQIDSSKETLLPSKRWNCSRGCLRCREVLCDKLMILVSPLPKGQKAQQHACARSALCQEFLADGLWPTQTWFDPFYVSDVVRPCLAITKTPLYRFVFFSIVSELFFWLCRIESARSPSSPNRQQ